MKILSFIVLLFPLHVIAQAYSDPYLGQPQDTIVKYKNLTIRIFNSNPKAGYTEFDGATSNKEGGITLTYRESFNNDSCQYEDFVFNSGDELVKHIEVLPATYEYGQIGRMIKEEGFYKLNEHLLYHKTENLKVTVETISQNGSDWALFSYTKKSFKTPYD